MNRLLNHLITIIILVLTIGIGVLITYYPCIVGYLAISLIGLCFYITTHGIVTTIRSRL